MATRYRRRWIVACAVAAAVVIPVAGELVARNQLEGRVVDLGRALPGVSTALAGGPAMIQLASGRIDIGLAVSDATLNAYASCRTNQDLSVRSGDGVLVVSTERTVRGMTLPVDVTLVPRRDGDRWSLIPDSVSAAGISLPAGRASKVLTGKDAAGSQLATRLLDGVPLPGDERLAITAVNFTEGAVHVTASTAINRTREAEGRGLSGLRSCLATQEG